MYTDINEIKLDQIKDKKELINLQINNEHQMYQTLEDKYAVPPTSWNKNSDDDGNGGGSGFQTGTSKVQDVFALGPRGNSLDDDGQFQQQQNVVGNINISSDVESINIKVQKIMDECKRYEAARSGGASRIEPAASAAKYIKEGGEVELQEELGEEDQLHLNDRPQQRINGDENGQMGGSQKRKNEIFEESNGQQNLQKVP